MLPHARGQRRAVSEVRSPAVPQPGFNLFRLAQRRCGGQLQFALPGLPGNYVHATDREWRCWNRRLRADLLSWQGFQLNARGGLNEPVACELRVHHPYSRTIVHRVHDAATDYLRRLVAQHAPREPGRVIAWPGSPAAQPPQTPSAIP